jgi:hypothetical protein
MGSLAPKLQINNSSKMAKENLSFKNYDNYDEFEEMDDFEEYEKMAEQDDEMDYDEENY